jgi:hypothetical protein
MHFFEAGKDDNFYIFDWGKIFTKCFDSSIESLLFDESVFILSNNVLSQLIVTENDQAKRKRNEQPTEWEWIESNHSFHAWSVDQNQCYDGFESKCKVEWFVLHCLFENRTFSCLANDQCGPLTHHNRKEVASLTGVFEFLPLFIVLFLTKKKTNFN